MVFTLIRMSALKVRQVQQAAGVSSDQSGIDLSKRWLSY
jgi:hypothetical protein